MSVLDDHREMVEQAERNRRELLRVMSATPEEIAHETLALIEEVTALVSRYIVMPDEHALLTVALWVLHTHSVEASFVTPYLLILSAEKGSGKS